MRSKILTAMGVIMLICFMTLGFLAFPVGIPICGAIGLFYGIKSKDKPFIKWCSLALGIGILLAIYTLLVISNM
jgi:hypothetical protein